VQRVIWSLLAAGVLAGCATSSVESRRREKAASYATFSPEFQHLVEQGQIRRGMPPDAVYIAWGKPAQILDREDNSGVVTIWLYHGNWTDEVRYWPYNYSRVPTTDYDIRSYISAEVVFRDDLVSSWRMFPKPTY